MDPVSESPLNVNVIVVPLVVVEDGLIVIVFSAPDGAVPDVLLLDGSEL